MCRDSPRGDRLPAWRRQRGAAIAILIQLCAKAQCHGQENGRLTLSLREAAATLHMSVVTADKALGALVEMGFSAACRTSRSRSRGTRSRSSASATSPQRTTGGAGARTRCSSPRRDRRPGRIDHLAGLPRPRPHARRRCRDGLRPRKGRLIRFSSAMLLTGHENGQLTSTRRAPCGASRPARAADRRRGDIQAPGRRQAVTFATRVALAVAGEARRSRARQSVRYLCMSARERVSVGNGLNPRVA